MSTIADPRIEESFSAVAWSDGALRLLDQRLLPGSEQYLQIETSEQVAGAIRDMVVRGAPAIGVAAAYGVVLAAAESYAEDAANWRDRIEPRLAVLAHSRPTAVNLGWAVAQMRKVLANLEGDPVPALLREARAIQARDIEANRRMGDLGAAIIGDTRCVLTHCNAGALATGGYGTALGVVRSARARGTLEMVYASETRPWLQGARLTAWELSRDRIPVTLVAEGAASQLLRSGTVGWVIVGADRIAANGDVANKIGTYTHAVLARHHGVRFMVAAPLSTVDPDTACGADIPIEQRDGRELTDILGQRIAAPGVAAYNPVFDVTPAELIDVIVTERGVIHNPDRTKIRGLIEA